MSLGHQFRELLELGVRPAFALPDHGPVHLDLDYSGHPGLGEALVHELPDRLRIDGRLHVFLEPSREHFEHIDFLFHGDLLRKPACSAGGLDDGQLEDLPVPEAQDQSLVRRQDTGFLEGLHPRKVEPGLDLAILHLGQRIPQILDHSPFAHPFHGLFLSLTSGPFRT